MHAQKRKEYLVFMIKLCLASYLPNPFLGATNCFVPPTKVYWRHTDTFFFLVQNTVHIVNKSTSAPLLKRKSKPFKLKYFN